jgi:hypothetical protein
MIKARRSQAVYWTRALWAGLSSPQESALATVVLGPLTVYREVRRTGIAKP